MLSKGFNLALRSGKLFAKPHVPKLQEPAARAGFLEPVELSKIVDELPEFMRPPVLFAYETGWRIRSEVLPLTWDRVDLEHGTVRIEPGGTKNREARTIHLTRSLRRLLEKQAKRRLDGVPWVFPGRDDMGPILEPAYHWDIARARAGLPRKLMHDMRRSAIRNMDRAGVPQRVAMEIAGHKTRSIYDRYRIVSDRDLREAARILDGARTVIVSVIEGGRKRAGRRVSS